MGVLASFCCVCVLFSLKAPTSHNGLTCWHNLNPGWCELNHPHLVGWSSIAHLIGKTDHLIRKKCSLNRDKLSFSRETGQFHRKNVVIYERKYSFLQAVHDCEKAQPRISELPNDPVLLNRMPCVISPVPPEEWSVLRCGC